MTQGLLFEILKYIRQVWPGLGLGVSFWGQAAVCWGWAGHVPILPLKGTWMMTRKPKSRFYCALLVFSWNPCLSSSVSLKILFQITPRCSFDRITWYGHERFDCQGIPSFALVFNVLQKLILLGKKPRICVKIVICFVILMLFIDCQ